jgi:hypothetical protein
LADIDGFHGVWVNTPQDAWAVGNPKQSYRAAWAHWDGVSWTVDTTTGPAQNIGILWSVWGAATNDVYAVGELGSIIHYDGASWSLQPSVTTFPLYGVHGSSASDIWAVGGNTVLHNDGTGFQPVSTGITGFNARAVWTDGTVVVIAAVGRVLRFDGSTWTDTPVPGFATAGGSVDNLASVWGSGPNDIYLAGSEPQFQASAWHYDGTSWQKIMAGTTKALHGVWGSSSTGVHMVGENRTMTYFDGSDWTKLPTCCGGQRHLWSVSGAGPNFAIAVGNEGAYQVFSSQ